MIGTKEAAIVDTSPRLNHTNNMQYARMSRGCQKQMDVIVGVDRVGLPPVARPRLALSAKHQPMGSLVSHSGRDEAAEAGQGLTFFRPPHFALYLTHTLFQRSTQPASLVTLLLDSSAASTLLL